MAHFHKIPSGEKISNQTIKAPGLSYTVGLWGYLGYSDKELYVDYYPQIGIDLERGGIVGNSRLYTVRGGPGKKARVEAFAVVANLIRNFGPGNYDLGFPRPVGGPTGSDPSQDVFFAVPDLLTASLCFQGRISRTIGQMLEPAKTEIWAAMGSSSGKFPIMYPDGLNHLHVKAY